MIAMSKDDKVLNTLVENLKWKNYILTDEGSLTKYLGVDVKYKANGNFELTQPFLIQRIIDLLEPQLLNHFYIKILWEMSESKIGTPEKQ